MASDIGKQLAAVARMARDKRIAELKDLAEDLAEASFLRGAPQLLNSTVIAYATAKLLEKPQVARSEGWKKQLAELSEKMEGAGEAFSKDESYAYELLEAALEDLQGFAQELPRAQLTLVEKARVKAATQIYAHGGSLQTAAHFANVPAQALSEYVGATRIPEKYETMSVRDRMKMARELLGA